MGAIQCYIKACTKCGGDLIYDDGDWKCWQCGQYCDMRVEMPSGVSHPVPIERPAPAESLDTRPTPEPSTNSNGDHDGQRHRRPYGARSARNINAVIRAKQVGDQRWWVRNRQIIDFLDQGKPVREIANLVGRGERQIRVVRERLADLRAEERA